MMNAISPSTCLNLWKWRKSYWFRDKLKKMKVIMPMMLKWLCRCQSCVCVPTAIYPFSMFLAANIWNATTAKQNFVGFVSASLRESGRVARSMNIVGKWPRFKSKNDLFIILSWIIISLPLICCEALFLIQYWKLVSSLLFSERDRYSNPSPRFPFVPCLHLAIFSSSWSSTLVAFWQLHTQAQ